MTLAQSIILFEDKQKEAGEIYNLHLFISLTVIESLEAAAGSVCCGGVLMPSPTHFSPCDLGSPAAPALCMFPGPGQDPLPFCFPMNWPFIQVSQTGLLLLAAKNKTTEQLTWQDLGNGLKWKQTLV